MKKDKNEELQSRREFFKSAAKAALPIIGAAVLASAPSIMKAAETPMGCQWGCTGNCYGGCDGTCGQSCSTVACKGTCSGNCNNTCYQLCVNSCYGGCSGGSYY